MLGPNIIGSATAWQFTGQTDPSTHPNTFATNNKALYWLSPTDAGIDMTGKTLAANSGSGSGNSSAISIDASRSNSVYTNSGKVYPLSLALNFIIKT